jgi:hypothetical protein
LKGSCSISILYVGCYGDVINSPIRDLNGLGISTTNEIAGGSIEACIAFCSSKGFIYAGVQKFKSCFFSINYFYNYLIQVFLNKALLNAIVETVMAHMACPVIVNLNVRLV